MAHLHKLSLTFIAAGWFACTFAAPKSNPDGFKNQKSVKSKYGFIENKGQIVDQNYHLNPGVLYLYNGNNISKGGLRVQLKQNGFSYEVIKTEIVSKKIRPDDPAFLSEQQPDDATFIVHRVDISFVGGNAGAKIIASDPATDYLNYYTPGTPEAGVKQVHHFKCVTYANVYPKIDVVFMLTDLENKGGFKYNFIVHPGGDVNNIRLKFNGASQTSLNQSGDVLIETVNGEIEESIPLSFQNDQSKNQHSVIAKFNSLSGENEYGIEVGNYNHQQTLVIDPLPWATYYGGSASDFSYGLNVDGFGNLLVAGTAVSTTAIATTGAFQTTYGGGTQDGMILKMDQGGGVKWCTYYGGTLADVCGGIEADSIGNIYVSGYSQSTTGIATAGSFKPAASGNYDCFLARFDSTGARVWATYYGGTGNDLPYYNCIALDKNSNIFMVGVTNSTGTQMSTTGVFKTTMLTSGDAYDAFVVKFTPSGARVWGTYFGGPTIDYGYGVALDAFANIYLTGYTASTSAVASTNGFQTTHGGGTNDAYLAKLDSTGVNRIWSTYYGGSGGDVGYSVATDINGAAVISGYTASSAGIATSGAYQTTFGGGTQDGLLVKFDSTGARRWGTYYGGSGADNILGVATDLSGNVFFIGNTASTSGIDTTGAYQTTNAGGTTDAFFGKLDSTGVSKWGSYYGGTAADNGIGIITNSVGSVFVSGQTASTSGIATPGAFQTAYGGPTAGFDAVIGGFPNNGNLPGIMNNTLTSVSPVCAGTAPATIVGSTPNGSSGPYYYTWLMSTTGATSGFAQASGINYNINYSPLAINTTTWYRRYVYTGTYSDTSPAVQVAIIPKPLVGFTINNPSQCLSTNNFLFTDTSTFSAGTLTRLWNFGTGTTDTSTLSSKSKIYSAIGSYSVKLLVTGSNGCKDSVTKTVSTGNKPNVGFTINNSIQCLKGNAFIYNDTSTISNGPLARIWNLGMGVNDTSTSGTANKTYTSNAAYTVKLISSSYGCMDSVTKTVTVNASPNAGYNVNNSSQCLGGNNFLFSDTSTFSGGTTTRKWNFGVSTNDTSSSATASKVYSVTGNYNVKLLITGSNGCKDSVTKTMNVGLKPNAGFTINSASQCINTNNFIFTDTSTVTSGTLTRIWNFGRGVSDTSSLATSTKTYTSTGTYTIKLIAVSFNGCNDSMIKTITINAKPTVGFTTNNNAQCINGNSFAFTDTSSVITGTVTRKWNFGSGVNDTSSLSSPSKIYTSSGSYAVRLISTTNNSCNDTVIKPITVYPKPTVGFSVNSATQCLNGNIFLFNDTSSIISGSILPIWTFGDATGSSSSGPAKSFSTQGTYTVKLLSTSNNGCKDSVTKNVIVNAKPNVGFTINNSSQCISGNNFSFSDTTSIGSGTYQRLWSFGNGDTSTLSVPVKSFGSAGTYSVKLLASSNLGCKDSAIALVTVNPKPLAAFTVSNSSQCINGNIFVFNDSSSISSGILSSSWIFGDGTISSLSNPNKSYSATGTFTVKLISVSNNNCKDSTTKTVTVNPKPNVNFLINNASQCVNTNSFTFTDSSSQSSGTFTRNWDFGDGNTSITTSPVKSYLNAGTYQVKLVDASNNGCKDSIIKTISVNPKPFVGFTLNNAAQCLNGNSFTMTDTSKISSGTFTRLWNFGDATTSTIVAPAKSFVISGTYTIKVVVTSNMGCRDSVSKSVQVYPRPFAGFSINNPTQCFFGNSFILTDTSKVSGTYNRSWNLGDLTTSNAASVTKAYPTTGVYYIVLKVTDQNICMDSIIQQVILKPNPAKPLITVISKSQLQSTPASHYLWLMNNNPVTNSNVQTLTLTQNGSYSVTIDSANGCSNTSDPYVASSVGISQVLANESISVYPNPATNELYINLGTSQNSKEIILEVFDAKGAKVMSTSQDTSSGGHYALDISSLSEGMYFVIVNGKAVKFRKQN